MRVLLFGKNGQLGSELVRQLQEKHEVLSCDRNQADLTNLNQIWSLVAQHEPRVVINAAAYTAVDKAESEPEFAEIINAIAPGVMAQSAREMGALFVHYSTDYVFDGRANSPYDEDYPTSPQSVYGSTKLAGEKAVGAAGGDHLILRTSWVYARHGHNFLNTMLRLAKERDELSIVDDQQGAPTYVPDLAYLTSELIDRYAADSESIHSGIYHASGGGCTTWYEFARKIFKLSGNGKIKLNPIKTVDHPTPAKRPSYSVLSNEKLYKHFALRLPQWEDALTGCLSSD